MRLLARCPRLNSGETGDDVEPVDHWKAALTAFSEVVSSVGEDQWAWAVPTCPEWTVRELVAHVAGFQQVTIGQLQTFEVGGLSLAGDPKAGWNAVRDGLVAAVDADGSLNEIMESAFGTGPFSEMLMLPTVDLIFHTWDLARAIGVDDTLPAATALACYEAMQPFDDAIRRSTGLYPDGYDDKIEPPHGADAQTLLICFGGRQP